MKYLRYSLALFVLAAPMLISAGCGMTNDNPISIDKMQEIRKKEADSRQNFHPGGAPPSGPSAGK